MKIGDKVEFYLFSEKRVGEIYNINKKEKTVSITFEGFNYPDVQTFKKLPKKPSDNPSNKSYVPPWYILK